MANTGDTIEIAVANETRASSVAWGAVIAGAVSAAVLSLILALLGAALGFAVASPWSPAGEIATTLAVGTVIWLIVMQWLSAGLGGFVTGRLRVRWSATGDEVFVRDTVHGFLSWALATLIVVGVAGSTVSAVVGTGVQAVGSAAGGGPRRGAGAAARGAEQPEDQREHRRRHRAGDHRAPRNAGRARFVGNRDFDGVTRVGHLCPLEQQCEENDDRNRDTKKPE
jgi:hypothetical protein